MYSIHFYQWTPVSSVKEFTKTFLGAKAEETKAESSDDGSDDDMGFGLFD